MTSPPPQDEFDMKSLTSKPNRMAIVNLIGERGEISFKELKSRLGIGVGTLYYHLDALSGIVGQNGSRQYILTERGKRAFDYLKTVEVPRPTGTKSAFRVPNILREIFLFESYVERLGQEPLSNLGLLFGLILFGSVLAALLRFEPDMLLIRNELALPISAFFEFMVSWLVVFTIIILLTTVFWKSRWNPTGIATATSFAFIPMIFLMTLAGLRAALKITQLTPLFVVPYFLILQVILGIWAAYILTISLRSAVDLPFEKALVVTLILLLINVGYLWLRGSLPKV